MKTSGTQVHLVHAMDRAKTTTFTLSSTEIYGLLSESLQLMKLLSTEKRDLEAIRNHHEERNIYLRNLHEEVMYHIERTYTERSQMIAEISSISKTLIESGNIDAGTVLMNRLIDFVSKNSPLKSSLDFKNERLLL
ncbi:hypothetical protein [Taibaiella chishuiensis]|uniref:Uncharacterized protein n=1 Tax=Taibaiella chishuiensis TaxID=1434707 RepID=A0A2P8D337_9BACT|nr:hypothetical protein [Taibaiella chishuiensis]PSK91634.1 hypothetical protein B0I18_105219 [Taibaiella chishuiensis]